MIFFIAIVVVSSWSSSSLLSVGPSVTIAICLQTSRVYRWMKRSDWAQRWFLVLRSNCPRSGVRASEASWPCSKQQFRATLNNGFQTLRCLPKTPVPRAEASCKPVSSIQVVSRVLVLCCHHQRTLFILDALKQLCVYIVCVCVFQLLL